MAIVNETQALKKLYKSVVGSETKKNEPSKIISELADNWNGGGGGYDAEVSVYIGPGSADTPEGTIISGDFETLHEMVADKIAPHVLLHIWDEQALARCATSQVNVYEVAESSIKFLGILPLTTTRSVVITWNSDNTLAF